MTRNWNLVIFLLVVVVLQFGFPITLYGRFWIGLYMLLYATMILFGVLVARAERERMAPYLVIALAFVVFGTWYAFDPDSSTVTLGMLISVGLFQLSLMLSLLRFIFRRSEATGPELILAAICVYLLLGGFFSVSFSTLETLAPGSFEDTVAPGQPVVWQQMLYYSYVTMATLGYGEVLPITPWARSLAILETVAGTLFLTTVIARLVGAYATPQRSEDAKPTTPEPGRSIHG